MESELVEQFLEGARATSTFARDEDRFRALFDAYRAFDRDSFRRLLAEAEVLERCEVVCHWIGSKECVLLCLELCGPPPEELPSLREFAAVAVRVATDEELVERLADAVSDRDPEAFRALVDELQVGQFCHLLCHWVCSVRGELICRVLCSPEPVGRGLGLADALAKAGQAISRLLDDEKAFAEAAAAVETQDCEGLRAAISSVGVVDGQCELVCRWICAWRCLWVCLQLCPAPPEGGAAPGLSEAFQFAQAAARLADAPGNVERLIAAAEAVPPTPVPWRELLDELELTPYCIQICHWICELICRRFCVCVCPPTSVAIFTKIGNLFYEFDVASGLGGNGLTLADNRAFYSSLQLNGGFGLVPGAPQIQYRFEWAPTDVNGNPTSPWTAVPGAKILPTNIGQFITTTPPFSMEVNVVNAPSTPTSFNIPPAVDGWVTVPPMFPPFPPPIPATATEFVPSASLAIIDTADPTLLQAWPATDETGVAAGGAANLAPAPASNLGTTSGALGPGAVTAIPVSPLAAAIPGGIGISVGPATFQVGGAGAAAGATSIPVVSQIVTGSIATGQTVMALNVYFGIRMRTRTLGDLSDGSDAGTCVHVAINNTLYNNVKHAYVTNSGDYAVYEIGVQELVSDICGDITLDTIHVLFTAAHPNLGDVGITITGNGVAGQTVPLPSPVPINWYDTVAYSVASLPNCAYILTLSVNLLLTDGINPFPGPLQDQIAFCKT
jgi:hypothetical protein